jgi:DNA-binding transcriptional LysR family regulator
MELRNLRTFQAVASTLSFTQAASELGYVQSTITAQIQSLETELGVPLFDRLGKRVTLTDSGARLLRYVDQLLALAEEAREATVGGNEPSGSLTISAAETVFTYRLPPVLHEFRTRYPEVRLLFRPSSVADLRRRVAEGTLDVAFMLEEPFQAAGLIVEQLTEERVVVVASPDHHLAGVPTVGPADLAGEPLLLTEHGCNYRILFEHALISAGVFPSTNLEFSSIETIKQCAMTGMGIAVLPEVAVVREIAQGSLTVLCWSGPPIKVATQMVWHKDKWLSPALKAFVAVTREMFDSAQPSLAVQGTARG